MALALAILSFKLHDVTKANPPRTISTNTPDSTQTPSGTFEPDRQEKILKSLFQYRGENWSGFSLHQWIEIITFARS
jgi:hypothetical protein